MANDVMCESNEERYSQLPSLFYKGSRMAISLMEGVAHIKLLLLRVMLAGHVRRMT